MATRRRVSSAPTAEEIVGGPGMRPERRRRQRREAALEREVAAFYRRAGYVVRTQVDCGFAGVADIVVGKTAGGRLIPLFIFELKDKLSFRTYHQAHGQVRNYRNYLDPFSGAGIICNETSLPRRRLDKLEALNGVGITIWDPPYDTGRVIRPTSRPSQSPRGSRR
jgi:hypothetical protein